MPRSEYKYTGGFQYIDPWENPGPKKRYDRRKVRRETIEIVIDETTREIANKVFEEIQL